eukprot:TRINITY_DN13922_c0_g1_i1.p1 TRINITY_DN13922_c0_g1~~TRINITY_DN13922_c0_g1_i1.p1  ORF type:complete len:929 (-),score=199.69 TRINITY_DN13922_c0_g1_i1:341-3127(-)
MSVSHQCPWLSFTKPTSNTCISFCSNCYPFSLQRRPSRRKVGRNAHLLVSQNRSSERGASINIKASVRTDDYKKESRLSFLQPVSIRIPVGEREIVIETARIGRQASGSVTVTDGETILYASVCMSKDPSEPSDFLPLTVNYQERFSAAGRTSGGYFKREGRAKDKEILVCRLIDRPLRPTIMKGFYHEIQILSWVWSYDGIHFPDSLAIVAAGTALALSEVPMTKPVAGVRIGLIDDQFLVNPTVQQMESSKLDLVMAGTSESILMIEGYSDFLAEELLLKAVEVGESAIRNICKDIEHLVKNHGKEKVLDTVRLPPPELYDHVEELAGKKLQKALQIKSKIPRMRTISTIEENILSVLTESGLVQEDNFVKPNDLVDEIDGSDEEDEILDGLVDEGDVHIKPTSRKAITQLFDPVDVKLVFKELTSKIMRRFIVQDGTRSDGRKPEEIRQIAAQCGLLPRAHGSALFTRGETQSLAVATLGGNSMGQRVDNLTEDEIKRFYLQYTFPPSCVGEVGRFGAPSRREIGHGTLAERALEPALPTAEEFPYTIRVESTITESNGSSSMASVCGGCLALMDAGVPLKCSIAGIAMGMIFDTRECGGDGRPVILSDIIGSEDALGDMDFKVAGNENGITAFQMDLKLTTGITLPTLKQAMLQAKNGICHILGEMKMCFPPPSGKLSRYAPCIDTLKVEISKLNLIIGTSGRVLKNIIDESGVDSIDIRQEDGLISIVSKDLESIEKAKSRINGLIMVPNVGDVYRDCEVKSLAPYGAFVEVAPGREGLVHVSELDTKFVARAEDVVKVGDHLDVKLIEVTDRGHLRLSRRALLPSPDKEALATEEAVSSSSSKLETSNRVAMEGKQVTASRVTSTNKPEKNTNDVISTVKPGKGSKQTMSDVKERTISKQIFTKDKKKSIKDLSPTVKQKSD